MEQGKAQIGITEIKIKTEVETRKTKKRKEAERERGSERWQSLLCEVVGHKVDLELKKVAWSGYIHIEAAAHFF